LDIFKVVEKDKLVTCFAFKLTKLATDYQYLLRVYIKNFEMSANFRATCV
jgi:hypothetical protein